MTERHKGQSSRAGLSRRRCFRWLDLSHVRVTCQADEVAATLAYCRIAEDHDAQIRTDTAVRRILITDGRAHGVELVDGTGTELAADSAMECAEHILTDLHRTAPASLEPPSAPGTQRRREHSDGHGTSGNSTALTTSRHRLVHPRAPRRVSP
jgi:hypothetical protein